MKCPDCGTPMENIGGEFICPRCDIESFDSIEELFDDLDKPMNKTLEESEWQQGGQK